MASLHRSISDESKPSGLMLGRLLEPCGRGPQTLCIQSSSIVASPRSRQPVSTTRGLRSTLFCGVASPCLLSILPGPDPAALPKQTWARSLPGRPWQKNPKGATRDVGANPVLFFPATTSLTGWTIGPGGWSRLADLPGLWANFSWEHGPWQSAVCRLPSSLPMTSPRERWHATIGQWEHIPFQSTTTWFIL